MSKLAREINAQVTGEVKLKKMRYAVIKHELSPAVMSPSLSAAKGVRMTATFSHTAWVNDLGTASEGTLLGEALYDTKRAIVEDVFGEFRPLIVEMRCALHDADTDRIRQLLTELEHQMFVDGM